MPPDAPEDPASDSAAAELKALCDVNERLQRELAELRRGEAVLRASEERYRQLFAKAGEAIFVLGADGTIQEANTAAATMHGYGVAEFVGMTHTDLDAPDMAVGIADAIRRAARGEWVEGEGVHVRRDGSHFPVEFSAGSLDVRGERLIVKFVRDVTARKCAEEALLRASDAADAGNRAKSAFLANMSHEIRTPLNAILGYAQLLERSLTLSPELRPSIEIIRKSGEQLLDLVNDVLVMSRVQTGLHKYNRYQVDLSRLLDDLDQTFSARAAAKRIRFAIDRAADLPARIVTDGNKLRQMLVSLLSNAVKFTKQGGVTVRVQTQRDEGGALRAVVEVEDTGPGIDREHLAEIFRPFSQTTVGILGHGGAGLGLALSRELARLLGGDITVESLLGRGSVFRLAVPIEVGVAPASERPGPPGRVMGVTEAGQHVRILIVDDDHDNRGWLRQLLTQVGFAVREADGGAEASDSLDTFRPHLVLLAMRRPAVEGAAELRAIRARTAGWRAAIVVTTASILEEEHHAIVEAGADGVLREPYILDEVFEAIRRELGVEYIFSGTPAPGHASEAVGLTVIPREHVSRLPPALVEELRNAARAADYDRVLQLLEAIPKPHAAAAVALRALLEQFAYDQIEAVLKE